MKRRRACPACGRDVAMRNLSSNKATMPHKCPHGKPCVAGTKFAGEGWNPGGARHSLACAECARDKSRHS